MAILRKKQVGNFTTISNTAIRDEKLSLKAKGLLLYMWSLPDDWIFYETELVKHSADGLASLKSGLKELEKYGYLVKQRVRRENGQLGENDWVISDEPIQNVDKDGFLPEVDFPTLEKPTLEKPTLENQPLLNTNLTKDLSIPITNDTNTRHKYGDNQNVLMTKDEYDKLSERFPNDLEKRINNLGYYMASTGKSYKSHYMTIIAWDRRDKEKTNTQNKPLDLNNVFDEKDNSDQWARLEERKNASNR